MDLLRTAVVDITAMVATCHALNCSPAEGELVLPRKLQLALDTHIGSHFGDQIELERRYELDSEKPGVLRLLAYRNRAVMARYDDALALAAATGSTPSLDAVRTTEQTKVGAGVNVEQTFARDLGGFLRAMWADGKTETYAFTEADRSFSIGASARGTPGAARPIRWAWHSPAICCRPATAAFSRVED